MNLLFLLPAFIAAFPPTETPPRRSDWRLLEKARGQAVQQEALSGGGQQQKQVGPVRRFRLALEGVRASGITLRSDSTYARLEVFPEAIGLPADWDAYRLLSFTVRNPGRHAVTVSTQVTGVRSVLYSTDTLRPGQSRTIRLDLRDLPITAGIRPRLYHPELLRWVLTGPLPNLALHLTDLTLWPLAAGDERAVVDPFGQRIRGNWPGKVRSVADLHHAAREEERNLAQHPGNWQPADAPNTFRATGYFRVEQDAQRCWWFITPDGRRFWSFGVTGVRTNGGRAGVTPYENRRYLYQQLPVLPEAYEPEGVRFYTANALKKWGSREKWRQTALKRLESWGLNTLGNWSDPDVLAESPLPYTRTFSTNTWPDLKVGTTNVSDVFHPEWARRVDTLLRQAARHRHERLLLGYFVDNEQNWEAPYLLEQAGPDAPLRTVWLRLLQRRFPTLEALNRALKTDFPDWSSAKKLKPGDVVAPESLQPVYALLEKEFAETYFQTVAGSLKTYDPNHLYLGCRFTKRIKPRPVVEVAGRYCDVITVNVYDWVPNAENMGRWYAYSQRPILIGEHHLALLSERTLPPTWWASPADARREYFKKYVEGWARMPYAVGSHWYQFADQEITGRSTDGENQPIGLVDLTDRPHAELVEAARFIGKQIYRWHDARQTPQPGDPGWVFDESRYDPRFPAMREWARAGVQGGIPYRAATPPNRVLHPGDDLQRQIDELAARGGGVLLLKKGDYPLHTTLTLRSNIVLRGENRDSTRLLVYLKAPFFKWTNGPSVSAVTASDAERVGVENLTLQYAAAPFEPVDKSGFLDEWDPAPFHRKETRDTTLFVHLLIFTRCQNSWVDGCNLLWAGAHPLGLSQCRHMTMRNNRIDRSYIKQDSMHGGYYGVWGSSYCLFYQEDVRRIRHFAPMLPGCRYNVILNCHFEVDVNFHDEDAGDNLVERCRIHTPVWHSWDAIGIGAQGKHRPPGPRNLLYANDVFSKGVPGYNRKMGAPVPESIYVVTTAFGQPNVSLLTPVPPAGGTLYAVKRTGDGTEK